MRVEHELSIEKSCWLMSVSKTAYYYQPKKKVTDEKIKIYLKGLAEKHRRWGFAKMLQKARMEMKPWNHKRLYRIYCELGLNIRIKPRKRIPKGEAKVLIQPLRSNVCWSMDFMSDALLTGEKFRTFNVIDDYNRECLLIRADKSLPSWKIISLLDEIALSKGYPEKIRVDHGSEFCSEIFQAWANLHGIEVSYIQPGKPAQNGFIERFNRTYREDILDSHWFHSLQEVREITMSWMDSYNIERPHESLGGLSPIHFAQWREQKMANRPMLENSIYK